MEQNVKSVILSLGGTEEMYKEIKPNGHGA